MKNGQENIVRNFFVEILYNATTAEFRFGDITLGVTDTIKNNFTTETDVKMDFTGTHVNRIDSIVVDIDVNRGDDPHILILTDTMSSGWVDNIRYALASWKYDKAGCYKFSVTAHIQGDQIDIVKSSWLKIDGQKPVIYENPVGKVLSEGDSVKLTVAATGTLPLSYKWYKDTLSGAGIHVLQPLTDVEKNIFSIGIVQLKDSDSYACVVKNEFGEDTSNVVYLNIQPLPPDSNSPNIAFAVDTGSGIEGNGGSVKVKLSKVYSKEIGVSISTLSTSTADTGNYHIDNSILRFGIGEIEKIFSFTTSNDLVPEPDKKIVFYVKAASNVKVDTSKNKYTYTIYDDDSDRDSTWPKIRFENTTGEGLEREAGSVQLELSKNTTDTIKVRLKVLSSSTISDSDFVLKEKEIVFAPNEVSKLVAFGITNDFIRESDKKVSLQIEILEGQKVSYGTNTLFEYTIHDDDVSIAQFASESDGIVEKSALVKVPVILTAKNSNQVIVQYSIVEPATVPSASGNGIDYSISGNNSVTFAPLTDTAWIEIDIKDDTVAEKDEAITIVLSSVTGGSSLTAIPDTLQYTIRDNENTSIGFDSLSTDVPENIGDTAVVHIWMNLTGPVQDTVKVEYTVSGGDAQGTDADYEVIGSVPQYILIKPGDTRADIKVKIIDDKKDENIEYFDLQLVSVTGGNVKISSMNIHKVRIIDDDIPYFYFDSLLITTQENVEKVTIPVRLSTVSVNEIKVKYAITGGKASGNGVDYAVSGSDTLLFKAGDTVQYIEVAIIKDLLDENDETITLSLMPVDTTAKPMAGAVALTLTIKDNTDQPAVGFNSITLQIPEEGKEVAVPVTLTGASGKIVSVYFQIKSENTNWNGGDVTILGHTSGIGKLTFPIGSLTQNIRVIPVDDLIDDDNESFTITLFNPENCALKSDSTVAINIVDNDYKITVQSAGNGTATPNGDTIIARGGNLSINATPAVNYHFAGWQTTAGLTLSSQFAAVSSVTGISANGTVTAKFSKDTVTVSLVAGSNGKAYIKGVFNGDFKVSYGSIVSFDSVKPSPNYHFKEWQVSEAAAIVIDSAASKTRPTATFKILGNGTITPGGTGKYQHGTSVAISVVLQPGWRIDGWTNATGTGTSVSVSMVRDTIVTVNVSPILAPTGVVCVKYDAQQNGGGTT